MTDNKNETQRRRLAPEQKIAILKARLVDKKPISDLCDQHGLQPSQFYCRVKCQAARAALVPAEEGRETKIV